MEIDVADEFSLSLRTIERETEQTAYGTWLIIKLARY